MWIMGDEEREVGGGGERRSVGWDGDGWDG